MSKTMALSLVEYVNHFLERTRYHIEQGTPPLDAYSEASIETIAKFGADRVQEFIENILRDFRHALILME